MWEILLKALIIIIIDITIKIILKTGESQKVIVSQTLRVQI